MAEVWNPDDLWEEHPKWPREAWVHEVGEEHTILGYRDWVKHQIEEENDGHT